MIPELLILVSLVLGGNDDLRTRKIKDWIWIPAVFAFIILTIGSVWFVTGGLLVWGIFYLMHRKGVIGGADPFAFAVLTSGTALFGIIVGWVGFAFAGLSAVVFVSLTKKKDVARRFRYPLVTFIALGYVLGLTFTLIYAPQSISGIM